MNRLVARSLATALAAGLALALSGCASLAHVDWSGNRHRLTETQLRYVHFLRWGEYEAASMLVKPDLRAKFLKEIRPYTNVRISDYAVLDTKFNDDDTEATVVVSFSAYQMNRLVEHHWTETHVWVRDAGDSQWYVKPDLKQIRVALATLDPPSR